MPADLDDVDWSDPCAAAAALRPYYFRALAGGAEVSIRFDDRSVTYSQANLTELRARLEGFEEACAKLQGGTRRRFAITVGTRRYGAS